MLFESCVPAVDTDTQTETSRKSAITPPLASLGQEAGTQPQAPSPSDPVITPKTCDKTNCETWTRRMSRQIRLVRHSLTGLCIDDGRVTKPSQIHRLK